MAKETRLIKEGYQPRGPEKNAGYQPSDTERRGYQPSAPAEKPVGLNPPSGDSNVSSPEGKGQKADS